MRKSITVRLFVITAAFLMVFISVAMYCQSVFFQKFYMDKKKTQLEASVKRFSSLYSGGFINATSLELSMLQFEEDNNAKIIILDNSGTLIFNSPSIPDANINSVFSRLRISTDFINSIISSKETITQDYDNKEYNVKNIICLSPVTVNNTSEIILVVSSQQPIEEASAVIKDFYVYMAIGAVVLIIILSLIYSRMISKPLVILNNSASKIAEMDFTTKCPVKRDDEIGNLSNTLNFLSQKLDSALKELKTSNQKLQEDIEKERHLDKMRKEFVAGVSHELKTPIALISGYAEGLKDNIVDGESRDFYIDVIMDEADKMGSLVSDMLDLSQMESGTFKLKPGDFLLDELIDEVVKKHQTFLSEKDIKINISYMGSLKAFGDRGRIEQVLTNFLTNAIRHTPEGGYINVLSAAKDNQVYTEIENCGHNILPEDLKNIWDKFYKIDKSRSRVEGGTGLGLSIVKNILLLHNSNFGVKNTKIGVSFYFTLKQNRNSD